MILTTPLRPPFAAFRRHGAAASPAPTASVADGAAASARVAAAERARATDADALCEPAPERGWFESSRELRAGLIVIELAGPSAAAALQ
jgi:hypothetical protein